MANMKTTLNDNRLRVAAIVVLVAVALFGVYRYSGLNDANAQVALAGTSGSNGGAVQTSSAGSVGSGTCCGSGGGSTTAAEGTAALSGDVQKISVSVSGSGYNPNVIKLKAGVPTEITFGQSSGCTGIVQSQQLGFQADLTSGPQTVKLAALQPGTYGFACGMGMVNGQIVVQ